VKGAPRVCDKIEGDGVTNAMRPAMKIRILLCAGASLLLFAAIAAAHETGKPHKHHRSHKAQAMKPVQPKDPYAGYWNDPGRAAPPFSYRGNGI
jgi:hypothetical protein